MVELETNLRSLESQVTLVWKKFLKKLIVSKFLKKLIVFVFKKKIFEFDSKIQS